MRSLQPIKREPYTGPVIDLAAAMKTMNTNNSGDVNVIGDGDRPGEVQPTSQFHHRPPTSSGSRNMQDSSFSLSGE